MVMDGYKIPKKLPFSRKTLTAKVVLSYIFDYVIIMYVKGISLYELLLLTVLVELL